MLRMVTLRSNVRCKPTKDTNVDVPSFRPNGLSPQHTAFNGMPIYSVPFFFHFITHINHIPNRIKPEDLQIYLGSNDLKGNGTYYKAEKIIVHEQHNIPSSANDIAVIRVQGSIALSDRVKTIEYSPEEVPDGVVAQLTGWGLVVISFFFSYLTFQCK